MFEIKVPIKPVWTREAKQFVEQIKRDLGDVGGAPTQRKGLRLPNVGIAGAAGAALGIGSGIALVSQILDQFKGLTKMIQSIMRILIEFLRPIADIVTLLLQPVLAALRPILLFVRQIMAPFTQAAYQLAAAGNQAAAAGDTETASGLFGLSLQTGLAGLSSVILALSSQVVNIFIQGIAEIIAPLADALFPGLGDAILAGAAQVQEAVLAGTAIIIETQAEGITLAAEQFGIDLRDNFLSRVRDMTSEIIAGEDNSILQSWRENASKFRENADGTLTDIFGRFETGVDNFIVNAQDNISTTFDEIGRTFDEKIGSLASTIYSAIDRYFFSGFLPGGSSNFVTRFFND